VSLIVLSLLLLQAPQNPPQTQKAPPPIALPGSPTAPDAADSKSPPIPDVGVQSQATLTITKHIDPLYDPNKTPINGSWAGGMQGADIHEGEVTFSMQNVMFEGKPCKLFRATSRWDYHPNIRNKKIIFTPTLYVFAHITPDGRLLHTNTTYSGFGTPVQIDAIYNKDSIDMTITEGTSVRQQTLYPKFDMALFNNLFSPFIRDGLVVNQEKQVAFINPLSGAPTEVTATMHGRFQGKLYFREYEGYKIDTTTPDSKIVIQSMVSRHGQLLQVNLPDNQDALAYADVSRDEEDNWGKFKQEDWDKPASLSQPSRTRYHTMALPVLLTNPVMLLYPVPCAIAL